MSMFYPVAGRTGTPSPSSSCNLVIDEYANPFEVFGFEIGSLITEHTHQMFERDIGNFVRLHWRLDRNSVSKVLCAGLPVEQRDGQAVKFAV